MTRPARDHSALQRPGDLTGFPAHTVNAADALYRVHSKLGVWFFASAMDGRFDLAAPMGTCYTAGDPETALRECLGPALLEIGYVLETFLAGRELSAVYVDGWKLADTCVTAAAKYGVSLEISTTTYSLAQEWAAKWAAHGYDGIKYRSRCNPAADAGCFALFGPAGPGDPSIYPPDPDPTEVIGLATSLGIQVIRTPLLKGLTVKPPPGVI